MALPARPDRAARPAAPTRAPRRGARLAALTLAVAAPLALAVPVHADPTAGPTRSVRSEATAAVAEARAAYDAAVAAVELVSAQRDRLATSAGGAAAEAERLRAAVQADGGGGLGSVVLRLTSDGPTATDRAVEAADNAAHLAVLAAEAEQALDEAILAAEGARLAYDEVLAAQARQQIGWSALDAAEFAISLAQPGKHYDVDDAEQDARNRAALRRWERYLHRLGRAAVVPPAARRLADPARLPDGLDVLRSRSGEAVAGLAEVEDRRGDAVAVLPAETVRAVSTAFSRLGQPDVPGAGSPSTYACGGLVADAWGATDQLPADSVSQWHELETVPTASLQLGDVVVLGGRRHGLEESGVYVGEQQVIVAHPDTGTAAVQPLPARRLHGVKRVGLPASRTYPAPRAGACGVAPVAAETPAPAPVEPGSGSVSGVPLVLPIAPEAYRISAGFGQSGSMWASTHSGLDFAAPTGTPVVAVAAGTVTVEQPSWAGNLVSIDHGGGVETSYAHLDGVDVTPGQRVEQGQQVGTVGSEGNSTGPHLHLEVRLDGLAVDPSLVLAVPEVPRPTHPNGQVPTEALCSATADGVQLLACDAAVSFRLLAAAYAAETGTELCITDSYRSLEGQVALAAAKPGLAATPGTSVHGLGRAVDLCGGVERFDTAEHVWVATHGPTFGWVHPSWAAAGGSRPEPWHFEYGA